MGSDPRKRCTMIIFYLLTFIIFGFFMAIGQCLFYRLLDKISNKIYDHKYNKTKIDYEIKEKGDFINE